MTQLLRGQNTSSILRTLLPTKTWHLPRWSLCQLEERHGVDLGQGYKNELACATFIDYIAQEQRQGVAAILSRARLFGLQADGSIQTLETSKTKSF